MEFVDQEAPEKPAAMPRLLILSFSNISADARVLKQVAKFSEGFRVTTCGYGPKPRGAREHIQIPDEEAIWAYSRLDLILRQYRRAYWSNKAIISARKHLAHRKFDIVFANEIDAVPLALSLRPTNGVHADLHEYSPREKEDVLRWRLFVGPFRKWLSKTYLPKCASVTTVSQGLADAYEKNFGLNVQVALNATPYHDLSPRPVSQPIRLVHSGACLRDRDPMGMMEGVIAATKDVTFDLYLTPNDPGLLEEMKKRAMDAQNVTIHDPVPYEQLVETLNKYDVGISILPPVNFNHVWALPNKLFDYVQARLGLIIGPSPEKRRIVEGENIGAVMGGFKPEDLTAVIDSLTPQQVEEWKANSNRAAQRLSAGPQVAVWKDAIDRLRRNQRDGT